MEFTLKKPALILITFLLIFCLPFSARTDDFEQLRKDAAGIKTIQARFVQRKLMKILSKPLVSEGRFFFRAPDSFRWEYLKPLRSIIVSDKGEVKRYIMSAGKMTEDRSEGVQAMRIVLGEVVNWMGGRFDRNPSFKALLKDGTDTLITLVPVGQSMTGMIEKIEISVFKKTMAIKSVKIVEGEKAATIIDFSDVEINKAINESVFRDIE
jgi:outer membrane lipoprotein carrier protein